jgi:hypothetical protein
MLIEVANLVNMAKAHHRQFSFPEILFPWQTFLVEITKLSKTSPSDVAD